ncbi:hypothetical protein [Streptomyces sp. NPDC085479]
MTNFERDDDIDDIKDEVNRAHDDASAAFGRAKRAEEEARERCTTSLDAA